MTHFALVPQLTYDELTVLISALVAQVQADRGVLAKARSEEIRGALEERVAIGRALLTAMLEARATVQRPEADGPFEKVRVAWEGDQAAVAWREFPPAAAELTSDVLMRSAFRETGWPYGDDPSPGGDSK